MIQIHKVDVTYEDGNKGLSNIDLQIDKGELVYVTGSSGAGKSTLLRLMYADIMPSKGVVKVEGQNIGSMNHNSVAFLRRNVGVIFQDFKLLEEQTVYENLVLPLEIFYLNKSVIESKIHGILKALDIFTHRDSVVKKLSGGEKQRVAVARALLNDPFIVVADEPTGSLDAKNADKIMDMLLHKTAKGTTILIATHDQRIIKEYPGRVLYLDKGRITYDSREKAGADA
ncbi:cell division ATP-binding protein FtsE [Seleniivibrio woodruffii]|uniref:Cell division ATP-binding protein FtsE n=1 Tax=Seleniivibrio woodruffii TaxID=1078050 RepID=A0A4R1KAW0_9BACT|nr:ATP-binding cassette domain-containing protein [Seleniivibrio woodruffii]TCK61053.1 cell division ATP-binding protein FtsE [Seleniivibrio woodruffii]